MEPTWRIDLLGCLRVTAGGKSLSHFVMRRAGALLARLAMFPHRTHSRDELIEMLWPEEDVETTRLRFRQVLTTLRRSLGALGDVDALLTSERVDIRVNPDALVTDVGEMESALRAAGKQEDPRERAARLEKAIQLYRGELLPGFYEDWILSERERLAHRHIQSLGRLAACYVELGDIEGALDTARSAIHADPLREESHCALIGIYAAVGRSSEATRAYREMEQLLWKEFRVLPSPEAQALLERAQSQPPMPGAKPGALRPTLESVATTAPIPAERAFVFPALPSPLTTFFGHESDIKTLAAMLGPDQPPGAAPIRLVTLTGPGGSGKTRLALEVARNFQATYHNAVCFVPLAELHDASSIPRTIANLLGLHGSEHDDPLKRISNAIGLQPVLLLLDNLEQFGEEGGEHVRELLQRLSSLRCLVTSRTALEIEGEHEFAVPPLQVPEDDIAECASVSLFVDRARRARPGFALSTENRAAVVELCRSLEGIPLSIELAASRAAALTPAQLLERLSRRFELLASSRKEFPERQRSLWATLEWSYQQLTPGLQSLFRRLSVFQGGWTVESAASVCGAPNDSDSLDSLDQLRQRSMIQTVEQDGEIRFRMLTTLQEFAAVKLSSDEAASFRRAHAAYFVALCERADSEILGPNQLTWQSRLRAEHDNIAQAVEWATSAEGDVEAGVRIASATHRYMAWRSYLPEAVRWVEALFPHLDAISETLRARLLEAAGFVVDNAHTFELALSRYETALALYRKTGDEHGVARCLYHLGTSRAFYRDDLAEARRLLEKSIAKFRALNEPVRLAMASANLSVIARREGDYVAARSCLEYAAAMHRVSGYRSGIAWCLFMMGRTAFEEGDYVSAMPLFRDALALYLRLENRSWALAALFNIGNLQQAMGNLDFAEETCREALQLAHTSGEVAWQATYLAWSGDLASQRLDYISALQWYREALLLCERAEHKPGYAILLQRLAGIAAATGDVDRAVRLYAVSKSREAAVRLEIPEVIPLPKEVGTECLELLVVDEVYRDAARQGAEMTLDQAISYARSSGAPGVDRI